MAQNLAPGSPVVGMSTGAARLCLVLALIGLGAASYAAYIHYRLIADPFYTSLCDVGSTFSCSQVYSSRFGNFQGISVAVFGAIWFVTAALLSVAGMTARPSVRETVPGYLFAGSTLSLAVILYLAYASFFVLKLVCILCLITYAAVIGLFVVSGAATSISMLTLPRRFGSDLKLLASNPVGLVASLLVLVLAGSALAFFPRDVAAIALAESAEAEPVASATPSAPSTAVSATPAAAAGAAEATAEGGQQGASELERYMATAVRLPLVVPADGAKVLIVKFNDYQCPACGQSYMSYKPLLAKYEKSNPGAVKVVLKDYPLSSQCNNNMTTVLHAAACDAAVAVRLAREKGKAEALEEWLYSNQSAMTPESVRKAARDIGGVTDFEARYASTLEAVKSDIAYGKQLAVRSTPTFFINGVKVEGAMAPQFFDLAIAYELKHPRGQ